MPQKLLNQAAVPKFYVENCPILNLPWFFFVAGGSRLRFRQRAHFGPVHQHKARRNGPRPGFILGQPNPAVAELGNLGRPNRSATSNLKKKGTLFGEDQFLWGHIKKGKQIGATEQLRKLSRFTDTWPMECLFQATETDTWHTLSHGQWGVCFRQPN